LFEHGRVDAGRGRPPTAAVCKEPAALPRVMSLAPLRKPEWRTEPDERIVLVEA
jgi:hypothetical protein